MILWNCSAVDSGFQDEHCEKGLGKANSLLSYMCMVWSSTLCNSSCTQESTTGDDRSIALQWLLLITVADTMFIRHPGTCHNQRRRPSTQINYNNASPTPETPLRIPPVVSLVFLPKRSGFRDHKQAAFSCTKSIGPSTTAPSHCVACCPLGHLAAPSNLSHWPACVHR